MSLTAKRQIGVMYHVFVTAESNVKECIPKAQLLYGLCAPTTLRCLYRLLLFSKIYCKIVLCPSDTAMPQTMHSAQCQKKLKK